ncbi:MAG: PssE/Cps14G family polysaccharide biosynthesis glycosyltransferase [Bacilli bacterium]
MIFVILGTQDRSFDRLLSEVDNLINKKVIIKEVIVQAGKTEYKSKNMKILKTVSMKRFNELIVKSDYIITHGGVGSILDSLKQNKKVIAVPRLAIYKEHINNHQLQIINQLEKDGYLVGCQEVKNLEECINFIPDFCPKKYIGNNDRMINTIDNFISKIKL